MLEINITKIGTYDPPEIGIWKNHDFQNEFQIRVRNKKDESIVLHQGWLLRFNYWCGTGAGALVASDDEKKIHYIVDDQLKGKLVEQNDTEESEQQILLQNQGDETHYKSYMLQEDYEMRPGDEFCVKVTNLISHTESGKTDFWVSSVSVQGEQQNEKISICKSEFELEIPTFKSGEAVGVGYHIFVMWRTVGADMVFLNEEAVSAEGGKGILMDRNECEKQGEIRVSLIAQNKYGASVRKELSLKPSGPVIKRWEAVEETHDNVTSRYCCWKVLYADQIIYNDKDGYKAEDKELCKVTHYGHPGGWSGQLFDGKLRAIGFGGMVTEVTYHDSIDYPPVI